MNVVSSQQLIERLAWRYATKVFDPIRIILANVWDALEQALVLTPSSYGLQPWRFIVITDRPLREQLVQHSCGQRQVAECSHFVVFTIRRDIGPVEIDAYLRRISEVRGQPLEKLEDFRQVLLGSLVDGPVRPVINEWATRQVYIALGNFMTAAALIGVDTCPMEGIEPGKYDEVLGLTERGLATVVACAAGYRAAHDRNASLRKVRFHRDDVIERR
jgi:nitroreductase